MLRSSAPGILLAIGATLACTFGSTGKGEGGVDIMDTATGASSGADDGTAPAGSTSGGGSGGGEADGSGATPGDGTFTPSDESTDGGPPDGDTTTAGTTSDGDGDDGDPPSAGYGPCPAAGCEAWGEVCVQANPYYVCSRPCDEDDECPAAPGGTAMPGCFDVGQQSDMCFLDCSGGAQCPPGMVCNFYDHCAWQ